MVVNAKTQTGKLMSAHYTLVIGSKATSSWSLRPWLTMRMAGIAFDEIVIRLRQPETKAEILRYSPSGKVPFLKIVEDGKTWTVWDSLAICETIAERYPEANLWPESQAKRAKARAVAAEMHAGFPDVRNALSMDLTAKHPTPAMTEALESQIARIVQIWSHGIEHNGGPFMFGRFSVADAFFAPVATRFDTYGIALPEPALIYQKNLLSLPAMQEWKEAALKEPPL